MVKRDVEYIEVGDRRIAYRLRKGTAPCLVFLPGYASDMDGAKATALDAFAQERGVGMLRLDYSGTGASYGRFADGTMERWLEEVLCAIDRLTRGPLILVGSSMGGWLALHAGQLRPARMLALVGLAAAPDFTAWGVDSTKAGELADDGPMTRGFWESGQRHLMLNKKIAIDCPVRLIHGEKDEEVPVEVALRTVCALRSADVQLTILKGAGHRLSDKAEIAVILRTVASLLEPAR